MPVVVNYGPINPLDLIEIRLQLMLNSGIIVVDAGQDIGEACKGEKRALKPPGATTRSD